MPFQFSAQELCDRFLDFEVRLRLFETERSGTRFWEFVRLYLYQELQRAFGLVALPSFLSPRSALGYLRRLLIPLRGLYNSLIANPFFTGPGSLLISGCPRRVQDTQGRWTDPCFDPFLDHFSGSFFYIERVEENLHYASRRTSQVAYHDFFNVIGGLYRTVRGIFPTKTASLLLLREIETQLCRTFDCCIPVTRIILSILYSQDVLRLLYRALLDRVQPKVALFASLNYPELTLVVECKSRGIPTVEVQHGVIGRTDLCYTFPAGISPDSFPDFLFVYGDYWRNCTRFPISNDRILTIHNAFLREQLRSIPSCSRQNSVLFLSQPTIGLQLFQQALQLNSHPNFAGRVRYRIHPAERDWRSRYPELTQRDIALSDPETEPIHRALQQASVQVGVNSAALFDGLAMGIPTVLMPFAGIEQVESLISDQSAIRAEPGRLHEFIPRAPKPDPEIFLGPADALHLHDAIEQVLIRHSTTQCSPHSTNRCVA